MSSDFRKLLLKVAEEDFKSEIAAIEDGLERYKSLILEIAKAGKLDFAIWVEGSDTQFDQTEKDLSLLERGGLVKCQIKYTHRSAHHECRLTEKGAELATKLLKGT